MTPTPLPTVFRFHQSFGIEITNLLEFHEFERKIVMPGTNEWGLP